MNEIVLVDRLKQCYWPKWIRKWTLARVLASEPRPVYRDRTCGEQDDPWDLGRVHHFMQLLERGVTIDPISIESHAYGHGMAPPSWGPPFIDDGHHRFVAAVLAKQQTIPASFGGLVTTLDWLVGKRENPPPEVIG